MPKRTILIREAPLWESPEWTADDQFALFFKGIPKAYSP
jgi:hypothetical protein